LAAFAQENRDRWDDVCGGSPAISYCAEVGKTAYNNDNNPIHLRGRKLGTIVGVIWQAKNSLISPRGAEVLFAPKNAYYYIIDAGIGELFLRECDQIDAR
jgi:hypothetical protein